MRIKHFNTHVFITRKGQIAFLEKLTSRPEIQQTWFPITLNCDYFNAVLNVVLFSGLNNEEYQVVIGNDTTRYIIDDLEPACNYTFYIVAYMPMGASRMSDHVFQYTLEDGEIIL